MTGRDMSDAGEANRVAVVTGGARGIGLAIGRWFLAHGYDVALLDVDRATLAAAEAALALPSRVLAVPCDVSSPAEVEAAAGAVMARWGRVDALVNNAGVAVFKPALETSFAEWRHVLGTNLDGAFLCTQAFGAVMTAQKSGAIVNIASISGLRASTLRVAYGTSKAAIIHLTKQYAGGTRQLRRPGQRRLPRPRGDRDGEAGAQRGNPLGLLRHHPARTLRHHRRRWRTWSASCAARRRAT